jgi:multidrug resistance efflux pump
MSRMILVSVLISLSILAIAGGIGYWIYNNYNYYTTDDAQITGQTLNINSPQGGQLTALNVKLGDPVNAGQVIGIINTTNTTTPNSTTTSSAPTSIDVSSPIKGTIIQISAIQGQNVTPGLPLVEIADLTNSTVTAYIDENTINNVKPGQQVDVHIDAYNGTTYTGSIQHIVQSTAGQFSLLPTIDYADGNFSKVEQRIPVIVSLPGSGGNALVPGMSAEVTIHLH